MKKVMYFFAVLCCIPLMSMTTDPSKDKKAEADEADLIIGKWMPSNGRSVISIYKGKEANGEDPNKYYGKIVWLKQENDADGNPRKDINNEDESMRDKPLKGLKMVKDLEFQEVDGKTVIWDEGTIYDPNNGTEYSFKAELNKKKPDVLMGKGYIGVSLFGREDTWTRMVKK